MAGPQDIQRYPRGLIDLLGMRATGDTPHQLGASTNAVLEMLDFYLNDRLEFNTQTLSAAPAALGNFQFPNTVVPQGQMWAVYDYTVNCGGAIAVATAMKFSPVIFRNQSLVGNAAAYGPAISVAAGENGLGGIRFERPNLVMPGQSFGIQVSAITGAPATAHQCMIWFARLGV